MLMNMIFFTIFFLLPGELCESKLKYSKNKIRFARLITRFRENWNYLNIGDAFQSFAVENIFNEMQIPTSELASVERDKLDIYEGEQVIVPMQGYFGEASSLIWSSKITPIYIGFHLASACRQKFINSGTAEKMRNSGQAVGCRDRQTAKFLKSLNINAYFSGCLTMTFPRRTKEPENGRVIIVDIPDKIIKKKIPLSLRNNASILTQKYRYKRHSNYFVSIEEYQRFETKSRERLEYFKSEGRLVITSRIHVALPCVAMGIPVVFVSVHQDDRLDMLRGILKVYTEKDVINWNPRVRDIETIKDFIKENAVARLIEGEKACAK